jgi:hypothetical protein
MSKFDSASVRDSVSLLVAAMPYPCWLAGTEVNAVICTAFSQNDLKAFKLLVLLASLPQSTHALYYLAKRPVRLSTQTPMSMVLLSVIGCLERLATVMPWKRRNVSTLNPIEGCRLVAIAAQLVLRSSANVRPYFTTNKSKHWRKTVFGSIICSCS